MIIEELTPSPLQCLAFNDTLSNAILNYGIDKKITTEFQYYSDRSIEIEFTDIPVEAYVEMTNTQIISYTIQLAQKLDIIGTFATIKNTIINTSNCWGEMKLIYQRSGKTSFINITAEPNDCRIENPTVVFQFNVDYEWKSILIKPEESPPSDYKGFKVPFVQKDTLFYEQAYSDMDEENQKQLDFFFTSFTADRNMLMRLSLDFTLPKSQLSQSITSIITNISSYNTDCLNAISPIISISTHTLALYGDQSKLRGCIANHVDIKINSTAVFNGHILKLDQDLIVLSTMSGIPFSFQYSQEEIINLQTLPNTMIYFTMYDPNGIVREEALQYESVGSCLSKIKPLISFKETCLIVFPAHSERCTELYKNGVQTRFQQVLQEKASTASRIAYQVYQFDMFLTTGKYQKVCFKQDQVIKSSEYQFYQGNFAKRQKAYVQKMSKVYQPFSLIQSTIDFQFSYESALDEIQLLTIPLSITCVFVLLAVIIGVVISAIRNIQ